MRKIILLLAAGLLLLAGCSNIVQQENDTDSSSGGAAGAFLRVTAETEGFAGRKEEASARTALPTIDGSAVTDSEFAKALAAVDKVTNINVEMVEDVFDEAGDLLAEAGDTDKFWAQMYGKEVEGSTGALQDHIPSMEDLEKSLQEEVAGKIAGAVTPESLEKEL